MKQVALLLLLFNFCFFALHAQGTLVKDDFEGNGTISTWVGDDCGLNVALANPIQQASNPSATVLEYHDTGGLFANIRFDVDDNFELMHHHTFSFKIYIPANGLSGNEPNQVALKLQNNKLAEPWLTQSEIIKTVVLDEWQWVTFNFKTDNFINLDGSSPPPTERYDFNRVLIQVNGENNASPVRAYIDDFNYDGTISTVPVFDDLVWSDEFDGSGAIDSDKWFHQTQLPAGGSWFNNEIQHYTNRTDNAFVENGVLKIVAKRETFTDQGQTKDFTSARLNSKFAFQYGKVEIRAKLPSGVGTWPAIWMLGKNINEDGGYWDLQGFGTTTWPACGEIDIMEHWGQNQNYIQSATHTPSSHGNTVNHGGRLIPTVSEAFHVYGLTWTAEKLIFSVDDIIHYVYHPLEKNAATWPFDAEEYFLFNIAILPIIETSFSESTMEVDYIRVYQSSTTSTKEKEETNIPRSYPNPVDNELTIDLGREIQASIEVSIYSVDGALVKEMELRTSNQQLHLQQLGDLSKGVYLVQFSLGIESYSIKFIKQ
ncbi:MAG: family 16 glycosylhydrolase [Bacteroidota bacterium]